MSEEDDFLEELFSDPRVVVGVWADRTHVHRGRNEFTIDFVRHVPDPPGRALVARAIVPPNVAADLRDQLKRRLAGLHSVVHAGG